jgi:hypothetical protein
MPSRGVNRARATHRFAAVRHTARNEIFFPSFHGNPLAIDNQL